MAANGHTLRSHIDGSLVMRSFLGGNAGQLMMIESVRLHVSCVHVNFNYNSFI